MASGVADGLLKRTFFPTESKLRDTLLIERKIITLHGFNLDRRAKSLNLSTAEAACEAIVPRATAQATRDAIERA
jgi:hypothetical protein